jgi:hypothetical protein
LLCLVEHLLTIGEFAERCGLSRSALRFYDQSGLLCPRLVDSETRNHDRSQLGGTQPPHEQRVGHLGRRVVPGATLLIDGATFAVSSIAIAAIPHRFSAAPAPRPVRNEFIAGWRAVIDRGWLTTYAVHETVLNVLALSPLFVLGPLIAQRQLGGAPAWSAIALLTIAAAVICVSLPAAARAQLTLDRELRYPPRRPCR